MHSPDFSEKNIAKILEVFPNCVTESIDEQGHTKTSIDFDLLKQELSTHIVDGPRERYHLNWPGKREALLTANAPIAKTLRPCRQESVDFDTTQNLFIEGDNLDALKLLQETYLGKVKMIYIDPPYNTGRDFIYDDDFAESTDEYLRKSNQKDKEGNRLVANTDANGRFHSDWLSMMYSRLKLARNVLKDDGIIFVSIADHEIHNLRSLMNEVLGADNFVATLIWQKVFAPKNSARHFSEDHDYILVFGKNAAVWTPQLLARTAEMEARYSNDDNDERGPWTSGDLSARNYYGEGTYAVTCPSGRVIKGPPEGRYWAISHDKFMALNKDNRIWWGKDSNNMPRLKRFLSEVQGGRVPQTLLTYKEVGHTQEAKKELLARVTFANSDVVFDTPKPTRLLRHLLQIGTPSDEECVVMDFFAGTGTLQDAVMQQNVDDRGKRQCIMIQLPDALSGACANDALQTISDITKERIRHAGEKIKEENALTAPNLDIGFRVLKVDSSNMADVYYTPDAVDQDLFASLTDNIKEDRSAEDLLFQVLLDWGVDLTLPIGKERICDREVFFVNETALAACFVKDGEITEDFCKELAKREPLRVVFRDAGFADDSVKINVEQIFKLMSPHTEVKTI